MRASSQSEHSHQPSLAVRKGLVACGFVAAAAQQVAGDIGERGLRQRRKGQGRATSMAARPSRA